MTVKYQTIEIDLEDFTDDELYDELSNRGIRILASDSNSDTVSFRTLDEIVEAVDRVYQNRRLGKPYDRELDELIYNVLGRFV